MIFLRVRLYIDIKETALGRLNYIFLLNLFFFISYVLHHICENYIL